MKQRKRTKYIHEGQFAAEVDVNLIEDDTGWSPYLSVADACKLDDVRDALRRGDVATASRIARVFALHPVVAS
jgi:hypothetical protein